MKKSAFKYLTATCPLLSEPAKAAMLRRQIPLVQGFSAVLIENLIYYLTVFVFMLAGLPALAWLTEVPGGVKFPALLLMGAIAVSIAVTGLAIRYRWFVLARALEQLARGARQLRPTAAKPNGRRIESLVSQVRAVEDNLYTFYERRRRAFYMIFSLNMGAHLINVVEVYFILALMKVPSGSDTVSS